jgi:hypothetical protein
MGKEKDKHTKGEEARNGKGEGQTQKAKRQEMGKHNTKRYDERSVAKLKCTRECCRFAKVDGVVLEEIIDDICRLRILRLKIYKQVD